ncbi:hypothetical protein [Shimia sp.]|uniref:hypothetical protein n=1 Tax=Shimia sp. TaxID=1954381 RepID=UPI003B8B907B
MDKERRIEAGLRPEVGGHGYSSIVVMDFCRELLSRAFRELFPIDMGMSGLLINPSMPCTFSSNQEILAIVEPMILELERKLEATHNSH